MSNGRFEVTLSLPTSLSVPCGKDPVIGHTQVPLKEFTLEVLQLALINGFVKTVNDVSRGKDDKGFENEDDVWLAARDKRVDVWKKGVWAKGERGDSNLSLIKDQYYFEQMTERSLTSKKIDQEIKALVESVLGKDTKATFSNWMLAVATSAAGEEKDKIESIADSIESALLERAMARQADQEKAAAKIVVPDLSALLGKK